MWHVSLHKRPWTLNICSFIIIIFFFSCYVIFCLVRWQNIGRTHLCSDTFHIIFVSSHLNIFRNIICVSEYYHQTDGWLICDSVTTECLTTANPYLTACGYRRTGVRLLGGKGDRKRGDGQRGEMVKGMRKGSITRALNQGCFLRYSVHRDHELFY